MIRLFSIIVTYNGAQWVSGCLGSLQHSSGFFSNEVLVIDNGSTDKTVDIVRTSFPAVRLIPIGKNLGFGQANNIGLKFAIEANADYVFLLNQDATVEPNTLADLIKLHQQHNDFGILSPVHLNGSGTAVDAHFLNYFSKAHIEKFIEAAVLQRPYAKPVVETDFVNAAAWLISAACLKKTGGFAPVFFHYGEDDNYAQRALYHGFRIGISLKTRICHDREQRMGPSQWTSEKALKKDWTQLLVYACDVNRKTYKELLVRNFVRHIAGCLKFLFLPGGVQRRYHFIMAKNIVFFFRKIRQSRRIAVSKSATPFL